MCLSERRLQEVDIENTPAAQHEDSHGSRQRPAAAHLSGSGSSSSDSEQEQDFVSSVVAQPQGPTVHWGDVQEFHDDNSPEIKLRMTGAEVAGVEEPKQEAQASPEEASVEEVTVDMASCSVHAPPAAPPALTWPRQGLSAQTSDDSRQPGLNITQVGMSKRGAAGLRDLLRNQTTQTKADSIRSRLLESLRGTLKDWITDETQRFLRGARPLQGSGIPDVEEEQELDEDDLVDEVSPGERKQPSRAAPDYETLRVETKQLEIRVREFYKGSWILPEEQEELNGNKVSDGGDVKRVSGHMGALHKYLNYPAVCACPGLRVYRSTL